MTIDLFNLDRFVQAQAKDYARALSELRAGRKTTHWMWYVLPQLRGLGSSSMATHYGIASLDEARAYLAHPLLGPRLLECAEAMNGLRDTSATEVLGHVDAAKFKSCLTLFLQVEPDTEVLREALRKYYAGVEDERTIALLQTK
jgi:uncharacterized protein (DUF1810 family)